MKWFCMLRWIRQNCYGKFIDDYLDENLILFFWLCPGAGGLHKQSQDSFEELTSGIQFGDVYSFISEPDPRGQVYFNWDKINSKSNVVLKEGEHKDFMSRYILATIRISTSLCSLLRNTSIVIQLISILLTLILFMF